MHTYAKARMDWHEWHAGYANPNSSLALRLRVVQAQIKAALDGCSSGTHLTATVQSHLIALAQSVPIRLYPVTRPYHSPVSLVQRNS